MNTRVNGRTEDASGDGLARVLAFGVIAAALVLLVSALLVGPAQAETGAPTADSVLAEMGKAYAEVKSLEADFVQTSSGMSYASPMIQRGHLKEIFLKS